MTIPSQQPTPPIPPSSLQPPSAGVEVSVQSAEAPPIEFPDNDASNREGNTLLCLENALLERFGGPSGSPLTKEQITDLNKPANNKLRSETLDMIRQEYDIDFQAKLPKADPNKADSPIEFETYDYTIREHDKNGNVVMDPETGKPKVFMRLRSLKAKITWEIDVKVAGKTETIKCVQYIKTVCPLPKDPANLIGLQDAQHTALLHLKIYRQVHKKAMLGDKDYRNSGTSYQLNTEASRPVDIAKLRESLRKQSILNVKHYPHPSKRRIISIGKSFFFNPEMDETDGAAQYSRLEFFGGDKIYFGHSQEFDIKGRELVHIKKGEEIPGSGGKKADAEMTKYKKTMVRETGGVVPYGQHLYQQALNTTIKDPELNAYHDLLKSIPADSEAFENNIKEKNDKLQNDHKSEDVPCPKVDRLKLRNLEKAKLKEAKSNFGNEESQLRSNLLRGTIISIIKIFAEDYAVNKVVKGLVKQQSKELDEKLENYKEAISNKTGIEDAKNDLDKAYKNFKGVQDAVKKLQDHNDNIKQNRKHLELLGPKKAENKDPKKKAENQAIFDGSHDQTMSSIDNIIKQQMKTLKLYDPLLSEVIIAQMEEIHKILHPRAINP